MSETKRAVLALVAVWCIMLVVIFVESWGFWESGGSDFNPEEWNRQHFPGEPPPSDLSIEEWCKETKREC